MREIKFRAWDTINKNMRYDIAAIDFEKNRISFKTPEKRLVSENYREFWDLPYELMQYTGLKDINGREIYEGDIVKGYIGANNQEYTGVCEYSLKIAGFKFGNKKTNSYSKSTVTTARLNNKEVIGNIYENPELLEGK